MAELIDIFLIDPVTFSTETYQESDISLLNVNLSESVFNPNTDYVEFYIYDLNNNILNSSVPFTGYSILDNELYIDPNIDVTLSGFDQGTVNVVYNFYQTLLSSSTSVYYYIKEISPNRTELRLSSTTLTFNEISSSVTEYVNFRNNQSEFEDFYLNFGDNFTVIANNILLDVVGAEATVLIKLKSYSHWNDFVNVKTEEDAMNALVKMLNINLEKSTVTVDETFPCYLRNNIDKFKKFIL